ncbi:MAG: hypothetical protein CMM01_16650 [Rhodopirellula sp.]|nr:hypothetical protein [Rhodopirellula sp.]OUX50212.1 MAG: hypothetical protein CBE43_07675 [Rhodopirellula sp. TMED283]
MSSSPNHPTDFRRPMILVLSIVLLTTFAAICWNEGQRGEHKMLANGAGRVGLVMGGLWIAWPSLLRPINWLPPGIAVACVIALGVIAARPALALVAIPLVGTALFVTTIVRSFKP